MSILAKAGLGVAALGGIGIAGCYGMGVFGKVTPETAKVIDWAPLTSVTNFASVYGTNTVGKGYGRYLVADTESNKDKWNELFAKYEADKANETAKTNLSTDFADGKISKAFEDATVTNSDSSGKKSLNKLCDEMYKKTESDSGEVDFSSTTDSEDRFKRARDILKYCSPLGGKPSTIGSDETTYATETIGKDTSNTNILASTKDNNAFWEAQNKWFQSLSSSSPEMDAFFKPLKEAPGKTVREACEAAYKSTSNNTPSATQPKTEDVKKYCSFKKEGE